LFQRPDEAIVRGYDKGAERDLVSDGVYLTNYELLRKKMPLKFLKTLLILINIHNLLKI
jgi:hypothetical protein